VSRKISRRDVLIAGGGLTLGAVGAVVVTRTIASEPAAPPEVEPSTAVSAFGESQAGIARPGMPQSHGLLSVFDFDEATDPGFVGLLAGRLELLTTAIVECTHASDFDPQVTPDGPGDLTISVGLGPRVMTAVDPALPGTLDLPVFANDDSIAASHRGGDLLLAVHSSNPGILSAVLDRLTRDLAGTSLRWQQAGFRAAGYGTVTRNPLGYKDGIIVPHREDELAKSVWIADGPLAGGTICVIRRLRLAVPEFRSQPLARQDAIIGRERVDGTPLSGGQPDDPVDVNAKSADGTLLIPARSHVRAAHPAFTGSPLMLRRGYAFANGIVAGPDGQPIDDQGLVFICFQNDLATFTRTQLRMDELDDLLEYTTATASATFLILPGFSATSPLGASLPI
jgi:dye decolorizing peroxidase